MTEFNSNNEKEEVLFKSISGYEKVAPNKDLFNKITSALESNKVIKLSTFNMRVAAVAAILVLMVNVFAIQQINNQSATGSTEMETAELLNNYSIYDYE